MHEISPSFIPWGYRSTRDKAFVLGLPCHFTVFQNLYTLVAVACHLDMSPHLTFITKCSGLVGRSTHPNARLHRHSSYRGSKSQHHPHLSSMTPCDNLSDFCWCTTHIRALGTNSCHQPRCFGAPVLVFRHSTIR